MKRYILILSSFLLIFFNPLLLGATSRDTLDRSVKPEPTEPKPIKIGEYSTINLDNGITVFVVRKKGYPKFRASFNYRLPDINTDVRGLERSILSDMIMEVQKDSVFVKERERLERAGNQISISSQSCFIAGMKEDSDALFEYLGHFLNTGILDDETFEVAKKKKYSSLSGRGRVSGSSYSFPGRNESDEVARSREKWKQLKDSLRFNTIEYTSKPDEPDTSDLKNIRVEDIRDYFRKFINPDNTFCMIIGDFSEQEIKELSQKHLSHWQGGESYEERGEDKIITKNYPEKTQIYFLDTPGSMQSDITVTWPLDDAFPYADNEPVLKVLNQIFGASYSSYLNNNLRLEKGLTYGVKCFMGIDGTGGSMLVRTKVRTSETAYALENIIYEMLRIRNQLVSEENLQMAKNGLLGDYAVSMSAINSPAILGFGMVKEKYNLPDNYLEVYPSRINSIDALQVREAAQKYVKPHKCIIYIEGDLDKLGELRAWTP